MPETKTDLDALRLFVRYDEGSGPPIVLLHGINSDAADWRVVIDRIGPDYRCVAVDLLGFGESPKPTDIEYTADEHARVLDNTLREIGLDEPFVLVGYSLGGDIAIRYASTYPSKLRRLFLLSAPFYLPPEHFSAQGFGRQFLQEIVFQRIWKWIAGAKKRDTLMYQIATGKAEEFAAGFLRTDDVPTHWDIMGKNLRNCIGKATFVDDLPKLTMPTTFALGIRDPIVHPDQTPELKRLKPDMEIRRIVGLSADHFLLVAVPERVAEEILLDEVTGLHIRSDAGSGPATVFLHGFSDDPSFFDAVAGALGRRERTAQLDLLGFGESPKPASALYTMTDHEVAVVKTLQRSFTSGPVRLVGHGFGASVALRVAAAQPGLVREVVAFSPLGLAVPGNAGPIADADAAQVFAIREYAQTMIDDPRNQMAAERYQERVAPLLRTWEYAVLPLGAETLLDGVEAPTTVVAPTEDDRVAVGALEKAVAANPHATMVRPEGVRDYPAVDPGAAVLLLDPDATTEARSVASAPAPKTNAGLREARDAFGSATNNIFWRGLLWFIGGVALLFLGPVFRARPEGTARLLALGFAVWVLVEGISTVAGAFGLRREGKGGWLPWALIGALAVVAAAILFTRVQFSLVLLALVIAGRALYSGIADLYVARRVNRTPGPRWLLVAQGLLGVVIAVTIVFVPQAGGRLLRWVISGYLIAQGFLYLAYAVSVQWRIRKRVRSLLSQAKAHTGV